MAGTCRPVTFDEISNLSSKSLTFTCPGKTCDSFQRGVIYGTGPFHPTSSPCAAARYLGMINEAGSSYSVLPTRETGIDFLKGEAKNGVEPQFRCIRQGKISSGGACVHFSEDRIAFQVCPCSPEHAASQAQAAAAEAQKKEVEEQNRSLKGQMEKVELELAAAGDRNKALEAELTALKLTLMGRTDQLLDSQRELIQAQSARAEAQSARAEAEARAAELQTHLTRLEETAVNSDLAPPSELGSIPSTVAAIQSTGRPAPAGLEIDRVQQHQRAAAAVSQPSTNASHGSSIARTAQALMNDHASQDNSAAAAHESTDHE